MTLDWPFYDPDLILLALMFFGGLAAGLFAFRMWRSILHERRRPPDTLFDSAPLEKQSYTSLQAGLVTLVALAFTLGGGLSTVFASAGKHQFRKLPIDQLKAVDVYKATDEYHVDQSRKIRIENTGGRVLQGLSFVQKCSGQSRQHEHFEDGYVLHLLFDDPSLSDYYISAFRKSSSGKDKTIVLAQRELVRNLNLGEYNCPAFQEWIAQNIDPLFLPSN